MFRPSSGAQASTVHRPLNSREGRKELFYLALNGLNSVDVTADPVFKAGRATRLFERRYFAETAFVGRTDDVSADGRRFLMIKNTAGGGPQLVVVQHWTEQISRLAESH